MWLLCICGLLRDVLFYLLIGLEECLPGRDRAKFLHKAKNGGHCSEVAFGLNFHVRQRIINSFLCFSFALVISHQNDDHRIQFTQNGVNSPRATWTLRCQSVTHSQKKLFAGHRNQHMAATRQSLWIMPGRLPKGEEKQTFIFTLFGEAYHWT